MNKTIFKDRNIIKSKIEDYLTRNAETRFLHRLQILHYLAIHEDQSCITAGEIFNASPRAILNWLKKVNETGDLESIRDRPGKGRKTKLTQSQINRIKKVLQNPPAKAGIKEDKWNGKNLSKYITEKMGITLQGRQCQRLLLKMGASNKRGRPIKDAV
jgi:transposase